MIPEQIKSQIYRWLPPSLRSAAATLQGAWLNRWRYGSDLEERVERILDRERWSPDRWRALTEERLARLLHRAATEVPYYRDEWARRRRKGDRASWEVLENWPILEKEPVRRHPEAFVTDDMDTSRMYRERTSGTTGFPLKLWQSKETVRSWYALWEARVRRWHGVARGDRYATLGGRLVALPSRREPPFWAWNASFQQLYMSCYHLSPSLLPSYLEALGEYEVEYLLGYPSALHSLARGALREGVENVGIRVALCTSEPLYPHQRSAIAEAFRCPVRETYGMAEYVATASECEAGHLHLWPEIGKVEVVRGRDPVPGGTSGDLVGTGLLNLDMPLIRYRAGDWVTLPAEDLSCPCGRTLPGLRSVEGRRDDLLYTPDGREVGRLHAPVFKTDLPVVEAQILQETLERLRVRIVPDVGYGSAVEETIRDRIRSRMGSMDVEFELVAEVPREENGKFRAVICRLSRDRIEALG